MLLATSTVANSSRAKQQGLLSCKVVSVTAVCGHQEAIHQIFHAV
jgi:hypothetical protein